MQRRVTHSTDTIVGCWQPTDAIKLGRLEGEVQKYRASALRVERLLDDLTMWVTLLLSANET